MSNTEQVLAAGIGATVGFFIGGPAGAVMGFNIGLTAGTLLFPQPLPDGPRLEDFEQLQADPGAPLPVFYGTDVTNGFRMYLGPVTEIASTESVGKGGPEQTTFTYFQTLAVGLGEGPISGVAFIYENGELVYDVRPQRDDEGDDAYQQRLDMSAEYAQTFVLYRGTERQMPDPTLELIEGAGNVPGFRGLAYIVWPDRELKPDQANRHPQFKIGVVGRGELVLTSKAYPYLFQDGAGGAGGETTRGSYQPFWDDDAAGAGGEIVSGTMDVPIVDYEDWPPDAAAGAGGEVVAGTLHDPIQLYADWPPDTAEGAGGEIVGGIMVAPIVTYADWPPDAAIGVGGEIVSGTMTT